MNSQIASRTKLRQDRRLKVTGTRNRVGYTLVEVIIVALLLAVLMSGVWSMFQMQNRMILQGQRLSRESHSIRSAWSLFREDVNRICLPVVETNPRPRPIQPPAEMTSDQGTLDAGLRQSEQQIKPLEFIFEGGSDWVVFDTYRPWQQLPAVADLSSSATDDFQSNSASMFDSGSYEAETLGAGSDAQATPPNLISPFQRVCYLWINDEEILQYLNIELHAGNTQEDLSDEELTEQNLLDFSSEKPKRWLLRITCDHGVGSPMEADTSDSDSETFGGSGTEDFVSSGTDSLGTDPLGTAGNGLMSDRKQAWLRWFASLKDNRYIQFQQAIGNISDSSDTMTTGNDSQDSAALLDDSNAITAAIWTSDAGRIQIDWLPTVTDGQFRYLVNETWREKIDSQRRSDRIGLRAFEMQYDIDANHLPSPFSTDQPVSSMATDGLQSLDSFESLEQESTTWNEALSDTAALDELPEYNFVALAPIANVNSKPQRRPPSPMADTTFEPTSDNEVDFETGQPLNAPLSAEDF